MGKIKHLFMEERELLEAQSCSDHQDYKATKSLSNSYGGTSKPNMKNMQSHGIRVKSFKTFKNAK